MPPGLRGSRRAADELYWRGAWDEALALARSSSLGESAAESPASVEFDASLVRGWIALARGDIERRSRTRARAGICSWRAGTRRTSTRRSRSRARAARRGRTTKRRARTSTSCVELERDARPLASVVLGRRPRARLQRARPRPDVLDGVRDSRARGRAGSTPRSRSPAATTLEAARRSARRSARCQTRRTSGSRPRRVIAPQAAGRTGTVLFVRSRSTEASERQPTSRAAELLVVASLPSCSSSFSSAPSTSRTSRPPTRLGACGHRQRPRT